MSERLQADAAKMVTVVDDLVAWILTSRPELDESPTIAYVRKWNERLRESSSNDFDMDAALADSATRGRLYDPSTSSAAANVAKVRTGSQKFMLAEVYFQYPEGLTADEAVRIVGLEGKGSPWHRVSDLKEAGVLKPTGRERATSNGAMAEVLTMTFAARDAWSEKHGPLPPPEIISIFGDDVEFV